MTMPATQQKPAQQAMPNSMTMPAAQQKPAQQAMPNSMTMPLPSVPAPKDNNMYMSPIKKMKMSQPMMNSNVMGNNSVLGQQMANGNVMGTNNAMSNSNAMPYNNAMGKSIGNEMNYNTEGQVSLEEALGIIKEAVAGETEDRMFYDFLISNAPNNKDKEIIKGIRDDEIKHAKLFRQLYYQFTGKTIGPDQEVDFKKPATYCEGLIRALLGEQNAVRKYRKILFAMNARKDINILTEIITDEIRHGSLYNLLVHNNDCRF